MKHIDPYREATERYNNTIMDLDDSITTAMKSLFDNGDLSLIDRKVIVIYGFRTKDDHTPITSSSIILKRPSIGGPILVRDLEPSDLE